MPEDVPSDKWKFPPPTHPFSFGAPANTFVRFSAATVSARQLGCDILGGELKADSQDDSKLPYDSEFKSYIVMMTYSCHSRSRCGPQQA